MLIESAIILGGLYSQVDKSMKIDDQSVKKNVRAFTKLSEAQSKLERCQEEAFRQLAICAKRKNGILTCHLKMFQENFKVIKQIQFKEGKGIEELAQIGELQEAITQYVNLPAVSSGRVMTESQLMISFALRGIGGMMVKESEMNLKLASQNLSQANAVSAQVDSLCIALEGITKHVEIVTHLLEALGMLYIKAIKRITNILSERGLCGENYSKEELDAINIALQMTKIVYRIINTPIIDQDGVIEKESKKVIEEGQKLLDSVYRKA